MKNSIEEIITKKISAEYKDQSSIILMNKKDFKKLLKEVNIKTGQSTKFKNIKNKDKYYFGLRIYITKNLKKDEILIK